jgi:hypothetical protein
MQSHFEMTSVLSDQDDSFDNSAPQAKLDTPLINRRKTKNTNASSFSHLFQLSHSTFTLYKSEKHANAVGQLSLQFTEAFNALKTLLAICTHPAWHLIAPCAKYNKPDGVQVLQQTILLRMNQNEPLMDDIAVMSTFENLIYNAKMQLTRMSPTRHPLTYRFYLVLASLPPINEFETKSKISSLQRNLDIVQVRLDQIVEEHEKSLCCFLPLYAYPPRS